MTCPSPSSTSYVGTGSARIRLSDSSTRNAAGVVTLNAHGEHGGDNARHLFGGPVIEVAGRPADADTRVFGVTLPLNAPVVTTYSLSPSESVSPATRPT